MILGFTPIEFTGNIILFMLFFIFADRVLNCRIQSPVRYAVYFLGIIALLYFGTLPPKMSFFACFPFRCS